MITKRLIEGLAKQGYVVISTTDYLNMAKMDNNTDKIRELEARIEQLENIKYKLENELDDVLRSKGRCSIEEVYEGFYE